MSEGKDAREAFDMACELIQEAKGMAGPGSITDHLDAAENWIDVAQQRTRADDWQDIATAPRDGTRLIVGKWAWVQRSATDDEPAGEVWHLCFATTGHFLADKGYWTDGLERLVDPTHYLRLPAAPQVSA